MFSGFHVDLGVVQIMNVKDSFKKIVLVKDIINPWIDEKGVMTMSVYDFLLKENSLEL